jgi:putative Ca2+/H+ antiporter (TMEM165/GDT1 family)
MSVTLAKPLESEIRNDSQIMRKSNPVQSDATKNSVPEKKGSFWTVFGSTFLTIFLAEMGDKTQLATLLISAESQSPWIVFAGSALALISTSLLGVLIGYWIARRLSPKTLDISVSILLLIISILLLGDVIQG